ncbi:MAG TPA: maleylpyruvate isomerase family mycothiol-dependent enzyme [Actinomycetota bacterium]|jgi:uncharacterized protein (TIGR03083 family)|nr:maleylpyruvate isomerase family mycothiol-dependent enzyme [Actinomycetota bacterium]
MEASHKAATGPPNGGIDRARLHDALTATGDRLAYLVRHLPDTAVPVPKSDWTVGDIAAHVLLGHRLYTSLINGGSSPFTGRDSFFTDGEARSPVSAQMVPDFPERDGARLADLLVEETRALLEAAARYPDSHVVRWHWMDIEVGPFTCMALFHAIEHGHDIARALRRRFRIDPADARLALEGLKAILPAFLDKEAARGLTACLELRVRGGSQVFLLIDEGEASLHSSAPRGVDCRLSADPVAFLLVATGKVSQWGPIARGKLVAWGRKPWLAMQLTTLFPSPG